MKDARVANLIETETIFPKTKQEIDLLRALVSSGKYYINSSRVALEFLNENWLYLVAT